MLPHDAASRKHILDLLRRTVHAAGQPTGKKMERLAEIEKLFAGAGSVDQDQKHPRNTASPVAAQTRKRSHASASRVTA